MRATRSTSSSSCRRRSTRPASGSSPAGTSSASGSWTRNSKKATAARPASTPTSSAAARPTGRPTPPGRSPRSQRVPHASACGDMTSRYEAVRARMNTGELYVDEGEGLEALEAERTHGKELLHDFNHTRPGQTDERRRLLRELLGAVGRSTWIESPFLAAYGSHIYIGDDFYANFNLVIVDDADVHIGDRVMFGPNVTITTAGHPIEPSLRADGSQYSVPVHVEDD